MRTLALVPALTIGAIAIAPATAQAEAGPQWYDNGSLLPSGTVRPIAASQSTSPTLTLNNPSLGEVTCEDVNFPSAVWNEGGSGHGEAGVLSRSELSHSYTPPVPARHGAFGSSNCKAPTLQKQVEETYGIKPTVFVTAEMPLQMAPERQGEVCKNGTKALYECPSSEREVRWVRASGLNYARGQTSLPWNEALSPRRAAETSAGVETIGIGAEGKSCYPASKRLAEVPAGCIELNVVVPQIPIEDVFYGTLEPAVRNGLSNGLHPSHLEGREEPGLPWGTLQSNEELLGQATVTGELKIAGWGSVELIQAK